MVLKYWIQQKLLRKNTTNQKWKLTQPVNVINNYKPVH